MKTHKELPMLILFLIAAIALLVIAIAKSHPTPQTEAMAAAKYWGKYKFDRPIQVAMYKVSVKNKKYDFNTLKFTNIWTIDPNNNEIYLWDADPNDMRMLRFVFPQVNYKDFTKGD